MSLCEIGTALTCPSIFGKGSPVSNCWGQVRCRSVAAVHFELVVPADPETVAGQDRLPDIRPVPRFRIRDRSDVE
jgi:hypothetical protein